MLRQSHKRGWVGGREWDRWWGDEQPEAGYSYPLLGLFGLASYDSKKPAIGSNIPRGPERHLTTTGVIFRSVPSM